MKVLLQVEEDESATATADLGDGKSRRLSRIKVACIWTLTVDLKAAFRSFEGSLCDPSLLCHLYVVAERNVSFTLHRYPT